MLCFKWPLSTFVILATATTISIDAKRDFSIELLDMTSKVSDKDFFKVFKYSIHNEKMFSLDLQLDKNAKDWSMKLNFDALTKGNRRMNILKTEQVLYSITNYTIDDESFPPIIPACTWQFDFNSVVNKVHTFNVTIKGRVRKI